MVTNARTTYGELRDRILSDLDNDDKLAYLDAEEFVVWILQAEERICQICDIREEHTFRYLSRQTDYPLQDRPPITSVSKTAGLINITSVLHGLLVNDIINIRDVQGVDNANGKFLVSAIVDTSTFSIKKFGRIVGVTADLVNPQLTIIDHPFLTGESVTVAGTTDIDGTWVITKIDKDNFTITATFVSRDVYGGGATVIADTANTDTYVGGGRYWKESELPTHISVLKDSPLLYNGYTQEVTALSFTDLERKTQGLVDYTYIYPKCMALGFKNGAKYLRIYPKVSVDGDLTVLYTMGITPKNFYNDTLDMTIHLPSEHDTAIEEFVKAKIWLSRFKNPEMHKFHLGTFHERASNYNMRQPVTSRKLSYK